LAHVFERGFSGKESSGYGLSICRTIVEAHGGTVNIESGQGKGTAVTFTIPVDGGQSETRDKSE
jgi:signal transduction histidine kinase